MKSEDDGVNGGGVLGRMQKGEFIEKITLRRGHETQNFMLLV